MSDDDLSAGRWVLVWGQVQNKPAHPDDVVVEFFSHNEQWIGHCRRDRIRAGETPNFATQCISLKAVKRNRYARCEQTNGHAGLHTSDRHQWGSLQEDGGIDR